MAVSHVFSNAIGDFTGTITGFNSQGSTTTIVGTNLVRPSDWNSAHNQFYTLTGNTTGNSTASGTNVIFAGSGPISVGGSTGTIIISAPAAATNSFYEIRRMAWNPVATQFGSNQPLIYPIYVPNHLVISRWEGFISLSISTSSNSSHGGTLSMIVGLYTRNASTLSLATSGSGTYAWTNTSNNSTSVLSGLKEVSAGLAATMTPGDYWLLVMSRTSTANANWWTGSNVVNSMSSTNNAWSGRFMSASNNTDQQILGLGIFSTTTTAPPASIGFTAISGGGSLFSRFQDAPMNFKNFDL
jgi:hypothetical protein